MSIKVILFTVICLLFSGIGYAQNYYLGEYGTVIGEGVVYNYVTKYQVITLYNITNKYTFVSQARKDGTRIPDKVILGDIATMEDDNWTCPKAYSIVNNAFSSSQKIAVKGYKIQITMIIDSDNGSVMEVYFNFLPTEPFTGIPTEPFYTIERNLKKQIWFIMTAEGKKLNYGIVCWSQEIK